MAKSISVVISGVVLSLLVTTLGISQAVFAHVTVKPAEVASASYRTFTVNVPNEKVIPTTSVKLVIPSGVTNVTPTVKAGWQITTEKDGNGEAAAVRSVTWSGGEISDGLRDEFTFSAKTPDSQESLEWKAYQTYSDGTVVAWDKKESEHTGHDEGSAGPLSVTKVLSEVTTSEGAESASARYAKTTADRALLFALCGVVIGLISLFAATRRKK
jgi:uncharacterized protein YcnI